MGGISPRAVSSGGSGATLIALRTSDFTPTGVYTTALTEAAYTFGATSILHVQAFATLDAAPGFQPANVGCQILIGGAALFPGAFPGVQSAPNIGAASTWSAGFGVTLDLFIALDGANLKGWGGWRSTLGAASGSAAQFNPGSGAPPGDGVYSTIAAPVGAADIDVQFLSGYFGGLGDGVSTVRTVMIERVPSA